MLTRWILLIIAMACCTQAVGREPTFTIRRPTVIAFFHPVDEKTLERDIDTAAALDDFRFYAAKARGQLNKLGIDFHEVHSVSFRVNRDGKTTTVHPTRGGVGYCFIAPGKAPHIEYGVSTDADLVHMVSEYFGIKPK